jgi:tRNA (guanosine-2'-O-)-methyltransferase
MNASLYRLFCEHLSEHKQQRFDEVAAARTRHFTLVLEDIYQSQNASAILRTAEAFGVQDLHLIENSNSFSHYQRVSKGASKWLTLHQYNQTNDNTRSCLEHLKSQGYHIAVTHLNEKTIPIQELDFTKKIALVLGTELTGASITATELADSLVSIPMVGFTESLNVASAASIATHYATEKIKSNPSIPWQLTDDEKLEAKVQWARNSIYWWEKIESDWNANHEF